MKPKVSIIMPCYNYAHYLPEALQTALDQTYKDFEIICVDDESTDNTREVIHKFQGDNPAKIEYLWQKNKGLSGALNTGIRHAQGEYILPFDADDLLDPSFLEMTVPYLESNEADIVATNYKEFGERDNLVGLNEHPVHEDFLEHNQIVCSSLYRKVIWERIGGYDEKLFGYQDWNSWLRATKLGFRVKTLGIPLFMYRVHRGSMTTAMLKRHDELKAYMMDSLAKLNY